MENIKQLPEHLASQNLTYVSHSQLERPVCLRIFEYLYLKDDRKLIPVGVPAVAGGAAHDGIQSMLCESTPEFEAHMVANKRIREHTPISELDELKRDQYASDVEQMIDNGYMEVRQQFGDTVFTSEERVSMNHDRLHQEIMGYVDLTSEDSIVELKTKWNRLLPPKKDGTRGFSQIKLPTEPDRSHVRQVAIYWGATGKKPTLIYVSASGAITFNEKNCDLLSEQSLQYHFNQILHNAIVWQNLLAISTDPNELKYYVQPQWDDFRWRFMPEQYLQQAKELFTI